MIYVYCLCDYAHNRNIIYLYRTYVYYLCDFVHNMNHIYLYKICVIYVHRYIFLFLKLRKKNFNPRNESKISNLVFPMNLTSIIITPIHHCPFPRITGIILKKTNSEDLKGNTNQGCCFYTHNPWGLLHHCSTQSCQC